MKLIINEYDDEFVIRYKTKINKILDTSNRKLCTKIYKEVPCVCTSKKENNFLINDIGVVSAEFLSEVTGKNFEFAMDEALILMKSGIEKGYRQSIINNDSNISNAKILYTSEFFSGDIFVLNETLHYNEFAKINLNCYLIAFKCMGLMSSVPQTYEFYNLENESDLKKLGVIKSMEYNLLRDFYMKVIEYREKNCLTNITLDDLREFKDLYLRGQEKSKARVKNKSFDNE